MADQCRAGARNGLGIGGGSSAVGQLNSTQTKTQRRNTQRLRSCQDSGAPWLWLVWPVWLGPSPHPSPSPTGTTPLSTCQEPGKLWAHVRQQHCQSARLANRAAARSDSWVVLAKARCPSLGQGCRKSGLILMVKSPGFLHPFRDMSVWSVWSVWLFRSCCRLLSSGSRSGSSRRDQRAAGQLLSFYLLTLTSPAYLG